MTRPTNFYSDLSADYSMPELIPYDLATQLLEDAETYIRLHQEMLPIPLLSLSENICHF